MKVSVRTNVSQTAREESPTSALQHKAAGKAFLSGVMVLTLSTVLVKLIGLFYKIPMLHYLGSEGMGYFNAAYEWYGTLCVVTTSGLPLASSMLIAEARAAGDYVGIRRIERLTLGLFLLLGTLGTAALLFGAPSIARLIGSPDTGYALAAVSPTLFFSCLSGAYRGYFQGHQDMLPTAVSQIIEAVGKLVLGLGFAVFAWRRGMSAPHIAAWAMLGLGLGVAISVFYLVLHRRSYSASEVGRSLVLNAPMATSGNRSFGRLLSLAVPMTISSSVLCLTRLFDMTMILRRLQDVGYDTAGANALYGGYTTMAVPIFNLIPSLITSVALALVPTLSAAIEAGDRGGQRTTAQSAVRLTALLALPATLAVAVYSRTILSLLFRGEAAAVDATYPLLSILACSIFFSSLITVTNAILQAYGHVNIPIASMLIGALVKLIGAYGLIGIPSLNIYGAPISTFLCDSVIVGINLAMIAKHTDVLGSLRAALLRPLGVSLVAVGLPAVVYALLGRVGYSEIGLFFAAVPLTLAFFALLVIRSGLIGEQEMAMLPERWSKRIRAFLHVTPR